jgi:hypothetical protein
MTFRSLICIAILGAPLQAATLRLDARTIYEQAVSRNISLSPDGSTLQLDSGEVSQDDGPAAGWSYKPNVETLSSKVWIRKQLVIRNPRASSAVLMVGPGGNLNVSVNGRPLTLEQPRKTGFGLWQAYTVNPGVFKPGVNDIVMSGTGRVWIARGDDSPVALPHRSARSADGGVSWNADRLGPEGNISGEYYVRVFLEHYLASGSILLPVMDAGNLDGGPLAPPLAAAGPVRVAVQGEAAGQPGISMRVRSGTTYVPRKETWSEWVALDRAGNLERPRGRYVQVEVTLATGDPLVTPRLHELTVEAAPALVRDWTKGIKVLDAHNEEIVRTSIPFGYEPFTHPRLKELRTRYHLDEVVGDAKTELDLVARLAAWAAGQWKYWEGVKHLKDSYPAWDALDILSKHADGTPVGGFCAQYDLVFLQACESFGLAGRGISISNGSLGVPKVGGHEPTEIWSNQYRKWIYVDGTGAWYPVDSASGVPLSLWEVRRRQILALRGQNDQPIRVVTIAKTEHKWDGLTSDLGFAELRLIPRSNFLEEKAPLPLNQGFGRAWFWTGHYVWNDADAPAELLHANRVTRHGNFEWTLNQAHYALEPGATRGEFRVHLDTETPGFETFLVEVDSAGTHPVGAVFSWKLHPGRNRLKVWPRNNAGRDGIASWLELEMPS